ncbi:hypothetical protein BT69DRAFT_1280827 [Atractiella rhizophila]|nr:hypothetical protein BT69DRAFT_1280827 [Atractiella rhizophila]
MYIVAYVHNPVQQASQHTPSYHSSPITPITPTLVNTINAKRGLTRVETLLELLCLLAISKRECAMVF